MTALVHCYAVVACVALQAIYAHCEALHGSLSLHTDCTQPVQKVSHLLQPPCFFCRQLADGHVVHRAQAPDGEASDHLI